MKNDKSPGIDGYTVEFYKFFWVDICNFLIRSINQAHRDGQFSISQRRGMITCIPKEGKSKLYMKNWRPITLLNVDYKIASSANSNRIKKTLDTLISDTKKKGFIKGRYMGECTRLIADVLENTEKNNIPGLLLLIEFEKAFDSLEFDFIFDSLQFYGFGPSIIQWIKSLYRNSSCCITNNGHCSEFFLNTAWSKAG